MKQIQEWLGHSDFGAAANIYAHLDSRRNAQWFGTCFKLKKSQQPEARLLAKSLAETVGFEPTDRLITDQTISSRSRYDHFDTSPNDLSQHQHLRKRGELMGRTSKNIKLRIPEKPHKIKGFRSGCYRVATTISSQSRYDHFDTSPYLGESFRITILL